MKFRHEVPGNHSKWDAKTKRALLPEATLRAMGIPTTMIGKPDAPKKRVSQPSGVLKYLNSIPSPTDER